MLACILPVLLASVTLAVPTTPNFYNPRALVPRQGVSIKANDPFDRRWIEALTAVGDSYSVGLGAGHAVKGTSNVRLDFSSISIVCLFTLIRPS